MNKEKARLKLEKRATRSSGFSGYAKNRLLELKNEEQQEEVAQLVQQTFGDQEKAVSWMTKPCKALGDSVPLELIKTETGRQQVRDVLVRIDHGVMS